MASKLIPFRLRVGKDDDLLAVIVNLPAGKDMSTVIREALRLYFFNNKPVSQAQIVESPVILKEVKKSDDDVLSNLDGLLSDF